MNARAMSSGSSVWVAAPLALATMLATGAAAGWFLRVRVLVQIFSGPWAMVLSTAVGCLIASIALLWMISRSGQKHSSAIAGAAGGLLLIMGSLGIAENLLHTNLGLDLTGLHAGLVPGYGPVGRMGMNTALVLALFGVNLAAYACRLRLPALSAVRYLLVVALVLATAGLLTRWLNLSDLFSWYYAAGFNRMSPLTSLTIFLIAIPMWQLWERMLEAEWTEARLEATRILQTAAFTLTITAVATGIAGVTLLQSRLLDATRENLTSKANDYANSIDLQLTQRVDRASILSNQATVADALERFNRNPQDLAAVETLRSSAAALLKHGFQEIEFQGVKAGITGSGETIDNPQVVLTLRLAYPAKLLWKGSYFLETTVPVEGRSGRVGYIRSQQPLNGLTTLTGRANQFGRTGELSLCMAQPGGMRCFPQRSHPAPYFVRAAEAENHPLPSLAVSGQRGSLITEAGGKRVLAAYGPVGTTGIGLALQMDTVEILQPARSGLELAAPLIVMLIFAGFWGMNQRIRPLVQKLISSHEHIQHLATHDALTDLPNRLLLEDRCEMAIRSASRMNEQVALFMVDLDHFKAINDKMGHAAGDAVLVEVAARLRRCIRDSDTVARFGGDEFVLIIPGVQHPEGTAVIAEKILRSLNQPIEIGERMVRMSSSVGIAAYPEDGADMPRLLQHADSAMYGAKASGRNNFRVYAREATQVVYGS